MKKDEDLVQDLHWPQDYENGEIMNDEIIKSVFDQSEKIIRVGMYMFTDKDLA